jgi:glutamyl/glutaminyl-tRNA synthetase
LRTYSGSTYRGRLAPSPTGFLHLGHARTFWVAQQRALAAQGTLILRDEDLDPNRSQPHFRRAMMEDLRWLGLQWQEGPDVGGPFGPYTQSQRPGDGSTPAVVHARTWRWQCRLPTMTKASIPEPAGQPR